MVRTWEFLPQIYKNHVRGMTLLGKFIPKITNFGDLEGCQPTF